MYWKVGGASRMTLEKGIIQRYLSYDINALASVHDAALVTAMTRDVPHLVGDGFVSAVKLLKEVGKLILIMLYQFLGPLIFGLEVRLMGIAPLLLYPAVLGSYLTLRRATTSRYLKERNEKEDEVVDECSHISRNYPLIVHYLRREDAVSSFENAAKGYNGAAVNAATVLLNNDYFDGCVSSIVLAIFIIIEGTILIMSHDTSGLGMFLADLKVIKACGGAYGSIYNLLLKMEASFPHLMRIVSLLSLETDVHSRKLTLEHATAETTDLRAKMPKDTLYRLDLLPIMIKNFTPPQMRRSDVNFKLTTLQIQQGMLVAVNGPHGEGKATLLNFIGGAQVFERDSIGQTFVPSHLHVLTISLDNFFIQGTLFDNLVFGCGKESEDASLERVLAVCRLVGVSEDVVCLVSSKEIRMWTATLSHSEQQHLSMARALLADPHLLVAHRPALGLSETERKLLMTTLQAFVRERGLGRDPATLALRRPRTCIFSRDQGMDMEFADLVFEVSKKEGITTSKTCEPLQVSSCVGA
eukprot:gnl/TRDRNA2_/TRDRNA2_176337_c0_seq3.p1 gnl/TRDRNA2_/TRDRNA2_176337_c0~~gnl/TRDRNA2_/TRDRNA2_176337_c0_seq3.p1  ORF type:complete len:526 (-),score=75.36 gnl/TRDRNA2_/TRDRNA2_176337_c0_seq3:143-1720(-)